jgi:alkylated DNA nucleotide flippase Atl1
MNNEKREQKSALYALFAHVGKALANPHRLELLDLLVQAPRTVEDLAREAGAAGARRSVRQIVADRPEESPYWRVVEEDGRLLDLDESFRDVQREKLAGEGLEPDDGSVDVEQYGWRPEGD